MQVRRPDRTELERLVTELWEPLAKAMAAASACDELTADAREQTLAYKRDRLTEDHVRTLVADRDGELVGYTVGSVTGSPPIFTRSSELRIEELFVRPSARREGVATELVDQLLAWGHDRDCDSVSVGVVADNDAAREFYEKLGLERDRLTYRGRPPGDG